MENWINRWNNFLKEYPSLNIVDNIQTWNVPDVSPKNLAKDEVFWDKIRLCFPVAENVINLNNGAVSSSPFVVEKAYTGYYSLVNTAPSYYIWKVMEKGRELIREGLANLINCSKEEVAILRNATEALNNAIFGIELRAGDEVVACKQDYAKTISSWKQRELRDEIKVIWVEINGSESNEEMVEKYTSAFTEKTKVLLLTHVINWNGQVLPVELIIKEAKKENIKVILDAAHSFGILETDVKKLDCDYLATALHKWLSGPIPSAMLYVKKPEISKTWPLASASNPLSDDIRKFEELSIQLLPNILGLGYAMEFHLKLGRKNKEERVRHLRRYWTNQLKDIDGIKFNVPLNEDQCAVIANVALKNWEPAALEEMLLSKYNIHVSSVVWENMQGIRVTPNIYTEIESLQRLVDGLKA
ncbi:MAG TPA: aminotransferase class V-fold PLP-dependent enzyme [Cytophagales bacterium]|nr:aminotransferase class V-fold PLP-dependent enzyme [Cytophagales bacterium]